MTCQRVIGATDRRARALRDARIAVLQATQAPSPCEVDELRRLVAARDALWARLPGTIERLAARLADLTTYADAIGVEIAPVRQPR